MKRSRKRIKTPVVKHEVTPDCNHGCRFIRVSDELWLCPHTSYGRASYLKGAVEEGWRLLERAGGYDKLIADQLEAEAQAKIERATERERARELANKALRYR